MALTAKTCPFTGPYTIEGYGKHQGPTAVALKRAMARLGYLDWEPDKWDDRFNAKLEVALDLWDPGKDGYAEGRWTKLRAAKVPKGKPNAGQPALDGPAVALIQGEAAATKIKVPALGPVYNGGPSVLQYDLTHETRGVDLYPAFDTAFSAGTGLIAPEPLTIGAQSGATPGEAFFAVGASLIDYWFGHLDRTQPTGRKFAKGDLLGRVVATSIGGGPHAHVGINVERLWGAGRQLDHHDNYTHGAPLIGDQLRDGP